MGKIKNEMTRLYINKDRYMKNFRKQIKKLQDECKHKKTVFQGDAAGGSDSYYRCIECEKIL